MVKLLKFINKRFKPVVHPFNLNNAGLKTYAEWQYEKGLDTIAFYMPFTDKETMFSGKTVLDVGCGAAGKTLYYASLGAEMVYGVDVVERYAVEAEALAEKLDLTEKFKFLTADAAELPFSDDMFDTIVMNDAMEHVNKPEAVLTETLRVLKPGGRIYINFPPYNHPFGAHLSDAVYIPWVHVFFNEKTLIQAYKDLIKGLPDEEDRINLRITGDETGRETLGYINKMSIKRFRRMLDGMNIKPVYYSEAPLRNIFKFPARLPGFKEFFVKMATCVIEKGR